MNIAWGMNLGFSKPCADNFLIFEVRGVSWFIFLMDFVVSTAHMMYIVEILSILDHNNRSFNEGIES